MTTLLDRPTRRGFSWPQGEELWRLTAEDDTERPLTGADLFDPYSERTHHRVFDATELPPRRQRFRPQIFLLFGRRDMGKTMAMTAIARVMQHRYRRWGYDFKIATNYECKFADIVHPRLVEAILEFPPWAKHLYICIDEIQNYVYRRRPMRTMNVGFASFLTVVRKIRSECIFTTQFPSQVDIDVLMQVDGFIQCQQLMQGRAVKLYVHDFWGQYIGEERSQRQWPPKPWDADRVLYLLNTNNVWNLYDSEQLVGPRFLSEQVQEDVILRSWDGRLIREWEQPDGDGEDEVKAAVETYAPLAEPEEPQLPDSIEELVAQCPPKFQIRTIYDLAKQIDPSIKSFATLTKKLQGLGCDVHRVRNTWWVEKP